VGIIDLYTVKDKLIVAVAILPFLPGAHVRLTRFEKTNEMLVNCNALAAIRFDRASRDLRAHCQTLEELKKDMDAIFRRIRALRSKLSHDMPQAFTACSASVTAEDEDEVNF